MELLKLSYDELMAEVQKLNLNATPQLILEQNITKIFQNRAKELGVPTGAPIERPIWFTPVVEGVVVNLWMDARPGDNLRMAAVKFMQESAVQAGENIFIANAIELIKSVLPDNKLN